jgi:hypothetical protein
VIPLTDKTIWQKNYYVTQWDFDEKILLTHTLRMEM